MCKGPGVGMDSGVAGWREEHYGWGLVRDEGVVLAKAGEVGRDPCHQLRRLSCVPSQLILSFPHPLQPPGNYCSGFDHHQAAVLALELYINGTV